MLYWLIFTLIFIFFNDSKAQEPSKLNSELASHAPRAMAQVKKKTKSSLIHLKHLRISPSKKSDLEHRMDSASKAFEASKKKETYQFGESPGHTSSKESSDLLYKQQEQLRMLNLQNNVVPVGVRPFF